MPEYETVMINGNAVVIEKMITSGDLLIITLITVMTTIFVAMIILFLFGGWRR
jgi:hypothetical protein